MMSFEVVLLTTYALALLGIAQILRALGRRNTSPWASRTLVGHLRATGRRAEPLLDDDWPHSEVPRLYAGMAAVAALAAGALALGTLALRASGAALAPPLAVLALAVLSLVRITRSLRRKAPSAGTQPSRDLVP